LILSTRADEAKHRAEYDRVAFLLPSAKPESLPGAGDLIQIAARLTAELSLMKRSDCFFSSVPG
jgi:hypothetical protein